MKKAVLLYFLKRFLILVIVVSIVFSLFDLIVEGEVEVTIYEIVLASFFLALIDTYFDKKKKK